MVGVISLVGGLGRRTPSPHLRCQDGNPRENRVGIISLADSPLRSSCSRRRCVRL